MARKFLEGGDVLIRRLNALQAATAGQILVNAVEDGADVIVAEIEKNAPSRPGGGRLKGNIGRETILEGRASIGGGAATIGINKVSINIGPKKKAFYGGFVEKGHSNAAAHPFMVPALKAVSNKVVDVIGSRLRVAIDRARRA